MLGWDGVMADLKYTLVSFCMMYRFHVLLEMHILGDMFDRDVGIYRITDLSSPFRQLSFEDEAANHMYSSYCLKISVICVSGRAE